MSIVELATSLHDLDDEIISLEMDMFLDEKELKKKEEQKRKLLDNLLFYSEFEVLYKNNEKYELNSSFLYPYKESYDQQGNLEFVRKNSDEYKEDVNAYLEQLEEAYKDGRIDFSTYKKMKSDAIKLANKQLDKIKKEEKEQEEDVDLEADYRKILSNIEDTKEAFIINQIGEDSYGLLSNNYKNMQEVDRKILLRKTHVGLCKEMGITCDMDFTKYDFDSEETVNRDGYYIKTKDLNSMPYPLDTMILEQTFKLHIREIMLHKEYTPRQKETLTKLLHSSLDKQKELVFAQAKKRELNPYGN